MKKLPLLIFFAAIASASVSSAEPFEVFGIGQYSCATWQQSAGYQAQGEIWIWGYVSGANDRNPGNHLVGKTTDGPGITARVKAECLKDESQALVTATSRVFDQFAQEGR